MGVGLQGLFAQRAEFRLNRKLFGSNVATIQCENPQWREIRKWLFYMDDMARACTCLGTCQNFLCGYNFSLFTRQQCDIKYVPGDKKKWLKSTRARIKVYIAEQWTLYVHKLKNYWKGWPFTPSDSPMFLMNIFHILQMLNLKLKDSKEINLFTGRGVTVWENVHKSETVGMQDPPLYLCSYIMYSCGHCTMYITLYVCSYYVQCRKEQHVQLPLFLFRSLIEYWKLVYLTNTSLTPHQFLPRPSPQPSTISQPFPLALLSLTFPPMFK